MCRILPVFPSIPSVQDRSEERLGTYQVVLQLFRTHANTGVANDDPSCAIVVLHSLDGDIER